MRYQKLLFGASVFSAAIALNNRRHHPYMRPEAPIFQLELCHNQECSGRPPLPASIAALTSRPRGARSSPGEPLMISKRGAISAISERKYAAWAAGRRVLA
jgi:hypothetical protein